MRLSIIDTYDNDLLEVEIAPENPDEVEEGDHDFLDLCFDFKDELKRSGVSILFSHYRRDGKVHKFHFLAHCTPREKELISRRLKEISMRG